MKKIILKIDGMTCTACSSSLEKYLSKQEGIDDALVEILGAKQINALRKAGHYRRDVY